MKKAILTTIASATIATVLASSAFAGTTIRTIGNSTYINTTTSSGGFSSTVCRTIGNTVYCN